jgi:NAD(P)-dependent dehydrogenase (short-subunit alcohol dehydrogenase family)
MQDGVGQTAFVTGGAGGIGFAMARSSAKAAMRVATGIAEPRRNRPAHLEQRVDVRPCHYRILAAFERGARYGEGWYAPTANLKQPAALLPLLEGVDVVQRYEELGVSRLVIPLPALAATGGAIAGIRRFADEVLSKVG